MNVPQCAQHWSLIILWYLIILISNSSTPKTNRYFSNCDLTHPPLVPHMCVSESGQHWFRKWLVAYSAPSHYLNQCRIIVNWTLRNKFQWNCNRNTNKTFRSIKYIWKYRLRNGGHFVRWDGIILWYDMIKPIRYQNILHPGAADSYTLHNWKWFLDDNNN